MTNGVFSRLAVTAPPQSSVACGLGGLLGYMVGASTRTTTVVTVRIAVPAPDPVPVLVEHATALEALRYGLEKVADEYIRLRHDNPAAASTDFLQLISDRLSAELISLFLRADLLAVAAQIYGNAAREARG